MLHTKHAFHPCAFAKADLTLLNRLAEISCRWGRMRRASHPVEDLVRDELLSRLEHYQEQIRGIDDHLEQLHDKFPEVETLLDIHGVGLYTALVVIGELGEVDRFRCAKQVGAYAGLTAKVNQSGGHCYYGSITHQGPPWLRWVLTEAAIHVVRKDQALKNFYTRVRKRSGAKKARVAVARKLAEICWKRLRRWHIEHPQAVA